MKKLNNGIVYCWKMMYNSHIGSQSEIYEEGLMMKRRLLALVLAVLMLPVALPGALAAAPVRKNAPSPGETVTLSGTLVFYPKAVDHEAYAVLKLFEKAAFKDEGGIEREADELEIRDVPAKKFRAKQVYVTGPLIAKNDSNLLKCDFGVNPAKVTLIPKAKSVSLDKKTAQVLKDSTLQLTAAVKPAKARQVVEWKSNKTDVVTVDDKGLLTAVSHGKAIVTAKAPNGKKASCTVTVPVKVTGIELSETAVTLKKGKNIKLEALVIPDHATEGGVTWASDNTSVATVSGKGLVKGKGEGSATITATTKDGGFTATCLVTVGEIANGGNALEDLLLQAQEQYMVPGGTDPLLEPIEYPEGASVPPLKWESTAPAVASIGTDLLITAHAPGFAIIFANTGVRNSDGDLIVPAVPVYVSSPAFEYLDDSAEEDFHLTVDGKKIEIGMSLNQVQTLLPGGVTDSQEGGVNYYYADQTAIFSFRKDKLIDMSLYEGSKEATHRLVKVGDSLSALFSKYGAPYRFTAQYAEGLNGFIVMAQYVYNVGDDMGGAREINFGVDPATQKILYINCFGG